MHTHNEPGLNVDLSTDLDTNFTWTPPLAAQQTEIQLVLTGMPNNLRGGSDEIRAALAPIFPSQWPWPATIQHLVIVPDGWMSYLPFDLVRAETDKTILLERYDISYLPSAALM